MELLTLLSVSITVKLIVLLFLIALSAIFSSAETAFTSLSIIQISKLAETKKSGRLIKKLQEDPDNLLTTLLLGNNLVNIAATSLVTQMTISLWGEHTIAAVTLFFTAIILIFAELTPKRIALANNLLIARATVYLIFALSYLLLPIMIILRFISFILSWPFVRKKSNQISTEGILQMVSLAEDIGEIEEYENDMVKNVFHLNELSVDAIMTHRKDVFSLDKDMLLAEALPAIKDSHFSRIPVYQNEPENIVGIVLSKEILKAILQGKQESKLESYMHKPTFISQAKKADHLFKLFKDNHLKMAVILDEYGGLAGIVTQEDVIEEIFGELYDENEQKDFQPITQIANNHWEMLGTTPLHLVEEQLSISMPITKFAKTLGGFIMERNEEIPTVGLVILYQGVQFCVKTMEKNKIVCVDVKKQAQPDL